MPVSVHLMASGMPLGEQKGSSNFMAPEVIKNWNEKGIWCVDTQSDLFSVRIIAYLLLAGKHPFLDPMGISIEAMILNETIIPVPPSRKNEEIPEEYVRLTMKLLEKDKKRRYSTAEEALLERVEPTVACLAFGNRTLRKQYQTRGFARSNLGEFAESIRDFDEALRCVKDDNRKRAQILYQRAYAKWRLDKSSEACVDARESLGLGYAKSGWLVDKRAQRQSRETLRFAELLISGDISRKP